MNWTDAIGLKQWKGRQLKGLVLLGLFFSVLVLANSATLHQAVHSNANRPDHNCAATMLASGQLETAPCVAVVAATTLVPIVVNQFVVSFFSLASFNLPLSRGPPALFS